MGRALRPAGPIAVFGASGHTGQFVIRELVRRGRAPLMIGRDERKLRAAASSLGLEWAVARIDDAASLDRAFAGAAAVINCAGPFLDTAPAVIEASLRARAHYLHVTAEQGAALGAFEHYEEAAREADIAIVPAMAFYGGLGDLLATAALADWTGADTIELGVALDSWLPTRGTRLTGARNTARRLVVSDGRLDLLPDPAPQRSWDFPAPFGTQSMVALPFTETILISRHIQAREVNAYFNLKPLADIRNPDTPPPSPADESGASAQLFVVEAVARRNDEIRRRSARGRDIYAITAPLVVEGAERVLSGRITRTGVVAPGEVFCARSFLEALSPLLTVD